VGEGARGRGESAVKLEFGTNKRNVVLIARIVYCFPGGFAAFVRYPGVILIATAGIELLFFGNRKTGDPGRIPYATSSPCMGWSGVCR
jgi:hypothetical protein